MTTVAKAEKSRLTIPGLVDGHHYIVREPPGGWLLTPGKTPRLKSTARQRRNQIPLAGASRRGAERAEKTICQKCTNLRNNTTGMSAEVFAKLYRSRTPLGAETASEISANLAASDDQFKK